MYELIIDLEKRVKDLEMVVNQLANQQLKTNEHIGKLLDIQQSIISLTVKTK